MIDLDIEKSRSKYKDLGVLTDAIYRVTGSMIKGTPLAIQHEYQNIFTYDDLLEAYPELMENANIQLGQQSPSESYRPLYITDDEWGGKFRVQRVGSKGAKIGKKPTGPIKGYIYAWENNFERKHGLVSNPIEADTYSDLKGTINSEVMVKPYLDKYIKYFSQTDRDIYTLGEI